MKRRLKMGSDKIRVPDNELVEFIDKVKWTSHRVKDKIDRWIKLFPSIEYEHFNDEDCLDLVFPSDACVYDLCEEEHWDLIKDCIMEEMIGDDADEVINNLDDQGKEEIVGYLRDTFNDHMYAHVYETEHIYKLDHFGDAHIESMIDVFYEAGFCLLHNGEDYALGINGYALPNWNNLFLELEWISPEMFINYEAYVDEEQSYTITGKILYRLIKEYTDTKGELLLPEEYKYMQSWNDETKKRFLNLMFKHYSGVL